MFISQSASSDKNEIKTDDRFVLSVSPTQDRRWEQLGPDHEHDGPGGAVLLLAGEHHHCQRPHCPGLHDQEARARGNISIDIIVLCYTE